ncbi:MAG TPA: bacterial transcriptional activator domain-containing protein [bacterium]|nr:bacterial transcriptional activator domain-containing protein [bacterium]
MIRTTTIAAAVALAVAPAAWPLANGLSGCTFAAGGGPADGYVSGGYSFPLGPYFCLGPELGAGFGDGGATFIGGAGRLYLNRASASIAQPHLFLSGGLAVANDEVAAVDRADTGGYLHFGGGCDIDIPQSPVTPFFDLGAFVFPAREPQVGFTFGAGIRLNVARALWMEQRKRERLAEEKHIAESLARAREANSRGDYDEAIAVCGELLAAHPDREEVRELLQESERLLAESIPEPEPEPKPMPRPRPKPRPEPEPEPEIPTIPPEAVAAYERGKAAVSGGALGEAIYIFSAVVSECPSYGAARDALVDAYLLQGLDSYSRGRVSDALRAWRQALAYDPGSAKAQRYIDKAKRERR